MALEQIVKPKIENIILTNIPRKNFFFIIDEGRKIISLFTEGGKVMLLEGRLNINYLNNFPENHLNKEEMKTLSIGDTQYIIYYLWNPYKALVLKRRLLRGLIINGKLYISEEVDNESYKNIVESVYQDLLDIIKQIKTKYQ